MARWENDDVSHLNLPNPDESVTSYYDKNFEPCGEKIAIVKVTSTTHSDGRQSVAHYVRFARGELIDPHFADTNVRINSLQFTKVNKKTFDQYKRFLETRNSLYFTHSRRSHMENV